MYTLKTNILKYKKIYKLKISFKLNKKVKNLVFIFK